MIKPIITDFNDYELTSIDRTFEKQIYKSYNAFPRYMKYSFARNIIPYYGCQEDECCSVVWVNDNQKCVIDQLTYQEIDEIIRRYKRAKKRRIINI